MVSNAVYCFGMPRATLVVREKIIDDQGNILEFVIWRVPATSRSPSGVRYRLAFVRRGEVTPAVLYDNHSPKGHHRHVAGVEEPYVFVDVDQLLADFTADVQQIMGRG
jgi:Family of unknown function (DUF6516)